MKLMLFLLYELFTLATTILTHLYGKSLLKFVTSDIPDHVGFALLGRDGDEMREST